MKKLGTLFVAFAVVLLTGTFAVAQVTAAPEAFPFFQLGCLLVAGLLIVGLKQKYREMLVAEAVGVFALFTVLVSLFTEPVFLAIKAIF